MGAEKREDRPRKTWKTRLRAFWHGWGKPFLVVVLVLGSLRSAVADWNDVPTGSMKPTILEGDRIFVNKLAYDLKIPFTRIRLFEWAGPERGDVVILFSPSTEKRLVKRVVGLPGDRIELRNNRVFINGAAAHYAPLDQEATVDMTPVERERSRFATERLSDQAHPVMFTPGRPADRSFAPLTVPPGRYFVMGDNRDNSADSRVFGVVERSRIVGKVTRIALSVDPSRHYWPRWSRWFRPVP